jgi:hypothetical protein
MSDGDQMWDPKADHPFLTARHVDDLTDAVRALTHHLTEAARNHQQSLDMQRRTLEVLADIRDSTNALQEVITRQHTNGDAHAQEILP